jgi:hypothetical protein
MTIFSDLDLSVEVSMKKLSQQQLFPQPKEYKKNPDATATTLYVPLHRERHYIDRTTGASFGTTEEVTYKDEIVDDKGMVVPYEEILHLIQDKEGKYKQVKPYSRTTLMTGTFEIPRTSVENWIPESAYEVYVNHSKYKKEPERKRMEAMLFAKAKEWHDAGKA